MLLSKHLSKTVLISSASIVTLAMVAIAAQTVDWAELGESLSNRQETVDARISEVEPTPGPQENRQDAVLPLPVPKQPLPAEPRANSKVSSSGGGLLSLHSSVPSSARTARLTASADGVRPIARMPDRERFASADPNPLRQTALDPVSTFSIDVDTASYSFVRANLNDGRLPGPDAVRVEEMVNYFDYEYRVPDGRDVPFQTSVSVVETPWNKDTKLMQVGIQGYKVPLADLPPQNLVFLIDTSGSMADANKLPLLQQSFRLLLSSLRDEDEVAIVTYAGSAGVLLKPTKVSDKSSILEKINALTSGGSTAGHAGLKGAYELADEMTGDGEQTRVILATDGDFNVGLSDTESLKRFVTEKRKQGTALSVLGFGRGNYNDELMQTLAQNGQGVAAYIDTLSEARKVLVDQVVSSISMIAQDVKIQVEFNPATVAEYRLIGYETRALKTEDFKNDKVDAGDIGAGHNVTALYEITSVDSPARKFSDLRYENEHEAEKPVKGSYQGELAYVKLRYKMPGDENSQLIETAVTASSSDIPEKETLFAASVASFGQMLKGSDYLGDWTFEAVEDLARETRGEDRFGYRSEFLTLVRLAQVAER
ncbi:vWA domain-containing protein [Roseibium album]|uniref:Magnesium chelatase subunit D n=1 Tax=Roseibium album TaxID=311410 RepID=A0A0M6Z866_9HYPH|nr:VWA domain-containing protein [Roseibium album]CTQ57704.1 magnesium chelatase subunit D [Roseibium album]CTQ68602.1 magnesium chelatase subunit D [Roseibium album]CTQ70839.1 magnesium chelatase subunit D [Roseibium album]